VSAGGWYHCRVKPISRSAGRSVVACAAYRLGSRLHDRAVGEIHDYRRRSGIESVAAVAPDQAPWARDAEALWNACERRETRRNATLAREIELALPAAVGREERSRIAECFARELTTRYGVAVSLAVHRPGRGDKNFHAHILFTTRRVGADGLGEKTRELDDRKTGPQEITYLREYAAELINASLQRHGLDERVDHRSLAARGIVREPTRHVGVTAAAMERRGHASERGGKNRETVARNARLAELVDELAALDAEIAAEQQRRLDGRYDPAGDPPLEQEPLEADPPADIDAADREQRQAAFAEYLRPTIEAVEATGETSPGASWWESIKVALIHMALGLAEAWRSQFGRDA
jgi:hypothetical protein